MDKDTGGDGRPASRITGLLRRGPAKFMVGNLVMNPAGVHVPVFGTQMERFAGVEHADLPPPGAYEIADSFEKLKTKGQIAKTSAMTSTLQRELFPVKKHVPGPGEYVPIVIDKKEMRRKNVGGFLSTESRFASNPSPVPGPGAYLSPDDYGGLVRRTFNITLTDWGRRMAPPGGQAQGQWQASGGGEQHGRAVAVT
ncbi:hypothetical protein HK104_010552 [Borealophlyctis nickersoniae]|nr:hypothetical protein HK104_010552 [Borealophlyctis nickersoniae]